MGAKILVVDDSATMRQQVSFSLETGGFVVVQGKDGLEGLELVKSHRDAKLLITDVNMPNMDGLTMLETIKAQNLAPALPVLVLTTEMSGSLRERAKRAGARGWIVKPVAPANLIQAAKMLTGG